MIRPFIVAVIRLNLWWLALFGTVSALAGVASLHLGVSARELIGAGMETSSWLTMNSVASLIGLSYLLWRSGGRFNLSTLLAIVTGIGVCLGAMIRWPFEARPICVGSLLIAIAYCWTAIKEDLSRQ